jgi:transmembrane sensor
MMPATAKAITRNARVSNNPDPIEQAADWQIRLQEEPHARPAFEQWLQARDEHRVAWGKMERLWGKLGEIPAVQAPRAAAAARVPATTPASRASRPPRRRRWATAVLAASVAALAVLLAPQATLALRADFRTGVGETRSVTLADGSQVLLGPQSALRLVAGSSRQVELLRGQAYFQITPDPQHPFIARAGQMAVRVLGTAFDLDLLGNSAEVDLEHGSVQAESTQPPLSERLVPGQRLKFSWPSGRIERSSLDPAQVAAWRNGSLFVENQSVAEIVEHLQRYTPGWIIIADPTLKTRRITGVFDISDPTRALHALAQSLAVPSRQMTPWVHTLGNFCRSPQGENCRPLGGQRSAVNK